MEPDRGNGHRTMNPSQWGENPPFSGAAPTSTERVRPCFVYPGTFPGDCIRLLDWLQYSRILGQSRKYIYILYIIALTVRMAIGATFFHEDSAA